MAFLDGIRDSGSTQPKATGFLGGIKDAPAPRELTPTPILSTAFSPETRTSTPQQFTPGDFSVQRFAAETAGYPLRSGLKAGLTLQEFISPGSTAPIKPKEDFGEYAAYFLGEEPIETLQTTIPQGGGGVIDYIGQTADVALGLLPLYGSLSTGSKILTKAPSALKPLRVGGTSAIEKIAPNIIRDLPEPIIVPSAGKTTKAALDLNTAIVEAGFRELPVSQLAKYTPITKAQTVQDVASLISRDGDLAKSIAKGTTPVPEGVNEQVLFNAVKNQAIKDLDFDLMRDLAKSPIATRRSVAAQTLSASGFNNTPFDPVEAIRSITKTRIKASAAKYPGGYERVKKAALAEAKNSIKAVPTPKTWDEFVDSITCK